MKNNYLKLSSGYDQIKDKINVGVQHYSSLSKWGGELGFTIMEGKENLVLLDAGCGNGYLSHALQSRFENVSAKVSHHAFDFSKEMVANAQTKNPSVEHCVCALPDTPYNNEMFDLIMLSEVLEHLYEPVESLKELGRILSLDGRLVVTVPNGDRIAMSKVYPTKTKFQPMDDIMYTFSELNIMFRRAGFRIVEYSGFGGIYPLINGGGIFRRLRVKLINLILGGHPDSARFSKHLYFVLVKDDALLKNKFI